MLSTGSRAYTEDWQKSIQKGWCHENQQVGVVQAKTWSQIRMQGGVGFGRDSRMLKIFFPVLLIFPLRQRASTVSSWISLSFYTFSCFSWSLILFPILPVGTGSVQQSIPHGLFGHDVVLEGDIRCLSCIFSRYFWKI